jgi:hypothetical protein
MRDAVVHQVPGAVILLDFLLNVRVNRRTRRSVDEVASAFLSGVPPRWLNRYVDLLWNFYRLLIKHRKIKDVFIQLSSNFFHFFSFFGTFLINVPSSLFPPSLKEKILFLCDITTLLLLIYLMPSVLHFLMRRIFDRLKRAFIYRGLQGDCSEPRVLLHVRSRT